MLTDRFQSLRPLLLIDATTCVACGLLMTAAARPLGLLTHIPEALLTYAGLALFAVAAFIGLVAARAAESAPAVGAVIAGNLGWCVASLWLSVGGVITPTALGQAFVALQALVVLALAVLEGRALAAATAARRRLSS